MKVRKFLPYVDFREITTIQIDGKSFDVDLSECDLGIPGEYMERKVERITAPDDLTTIRIITEEGRREFMVKHG